MQSSQFSQVVDVQLHTITCYAPSGKTHIYYKDVCESVKVIFNGWYSQNVKPGRRVKWRITSPEKVCCESCMHKALIYNACRHGMPCSHAFYKMYNNTCREYQAYLLYVTVHF